MELNGKVEKEPSVLSEGGGGAKRAFYIRRFLCFSYLIIILGRVAPEEGRSHIKMTRVLVVLFRVQNLEIDTF